MWTPIERLRAGVLVGAALLVLVVAGFLTYARLASRGPLRGLPERMGAEIQKETNGFTYSQSVKGHTLFTIHASKATQLKNGQVLLHDVGIVLYGEKDGGADRIYGKEFHYDQKAGVVRAIGEVQLDLQAPVPATGGGRAAFASGGTQVEPANRTAGQRQPVHVTTTGLLFQQSDQVASTDGPIRFEYNGMTGQAIGARFLARTGETTLEHAVRISGLRNGRPTVVTASHAELDRERQVLLLRTAHYIALPNGEGDGVVGQTLSANLMTVHLTQGGGIAGAEAEDHVELSNNEGVMRAPRAALRMSSEGRPDVAQMTGGVEFADGAGQDATAKTHGRSARAVMEFDRRGELRELRLMGGASISADMQGSGARKVQADEVDLRMAAEGEKRGWLDQVTARGNARVRSEITGPGKPAATEAFAADLLVAQMERGVDGAVTLRAIEGTGNTELQRSSAGLEESSRGATMEAHFTRVAGESPRKASAGTRPVTLVSAVQRGGIAIERKTQQKGEPPVVMHATGEEATYDGASGRETLTGGVEVSNTGSVMRAERVVLMGSAGDVNADGGVQVVYRSGLGAATALRGAVAGVGAPSEGGEPVYVTGWRAELRKEGGVATIFGGGTAGDGDKPRRARLWQGGSQVEAPVLVFRKSVGTLEAYGNEAGGAMPVRTVLVGQGQTSGAPSLDVNAEGTGGHGPRTGPAGEVRVPHVGHGDRAGPTVVTSGRLRYEEAEHRAVFSGGVLLQDANGSVESGEAIVTLRQQPVGRAVSAKAATKTGRQKPGVAEDRMFGSGLERVVATGGVVLREPGRSATGERAIYTSADEMFVLTGTAAVPPKVDDESGSVTGAVLRFRAGGSSVVMEGRSEDGTSGDGRVHSEMRSRP